MISKMRSDRVRQEQNRYCARRQEINDPISNV